MTDEEKTEARIKLIAKVKLALRIASASFDDEITDLIEASEADLRIAGVKTIDETNSLIIRAVVTYCKANFGESDEYDRLKQAYDEQKAQLSMATGYTSWGDESNG